MLTLTLMLVRRKSACKTSAGSSKIFRWLAPLLGPNLDPKTGPKQRPKRRNENVIQFWTPFWGPYLDRKMGPGIGVPLSQPCFEHFFRPCFRGHDEAGLWHSRRSEAHQGLPEARPRTQNVMARGQSEAHGDSNTRQD